MTYFLSKKSESRLNDVHPDLIAVCHRALQLSTVDFGIPEHGGLRSAAVQKMLFDTGKSMCDGTKKLSKHQSGDALDFYAYVDGKASWELSHLTTVAAAFLQAASELGVKLQWGGHWKNFKDMPHVQRVE